MDIATCYVWLCYVWLWLGCFVGIAGYPSLATDQQASCDRGWVEVAREQIGDELVIYCGKPEDIPRLKSLMNGIDRAARSPQCVGARECNYFVGKIGELLHIPYFKDVLTDKSSDGRMANEIYGFVSRAVESNASGWRAVAPDEAQRLANRGRFVVGVARHIDPHSTNHGHVVIVAPTPMARTDGGGSGPWVRDSQNPAVSLRASKRFGASVVTPIWAVWQPGGSIEQGGRS